MTPSTTELTLAGLRTLAVGEPDAPRVVVLAHGFQMTPEDLAPFAHALGLPAWFLFPEAPLPAAPRGRAWWHIDPAARAASMALGPRDFALQHPPDLPAARARFGHFLDTVTELAGRRPLIVGGFSQGGMVTVDTLLHTGRRPDGLVLFSSSRVAFDEWEPLLRGGALRGVPTLITHGIGDPDLAFAAGEALRDATLAAGAAVTWRPFDGGHEIPLVAWRALRKWLIGSPLPGT